MSGRLIAQRVREPHPRGAAERSDVNPTAGAVRGAVTPFDFIVGDHFCPLQCRDDSMRLFRDSVTMVEIEVFSYCNRRCWFCPNAVVDRLGTKEYMPEALYLRIVEQLAEIDYRGTISYSRYNEPLADRIILRRLEQARRRLPGATLHTNTNGDYLTRAYLDDLVAAGLNSLNIQIYLGNNDRYDHERVRKRLEHLTAKLDLAAVLAIDDPDRWLEARADWQGLRLRLYGRNFEVNGCSRGDSVPIQLSQPRTSPCLSPFHHLYVDYNGKVMPCCNLRSDVASHENAVIADLVDTPDIFSVYAGATLAAWRRSLIGFGPKHGHCASCTFVTYKDVPANRMAQDRLLAMATPGEGSA